MYLANEWKDYEIIAAGNGEKLERWGSVILLRPDPQAIWPMDEPEYVDAHYHRSSSGPFRSPWGQRSPCVIRCAFGRLSTRT